jgi:hypothetical protein
MKNHLSILYKFIVLLIILVGLNFVYTYFFYEKDLQKYSDIIELPRKVYNDKSEIIYIGESSDFTSRSNDVDKRAISDFISDYYPAKKFGFIRKAASHAGIYYELLRNIPENSNIKTVIVTLNLRSFDANWIYSNLETPLQKSIVLIKDYPPLFNRLLLAFRGYDIKTDAEREKQFKEKWKKDILVFPQPFKYNNVIDWDKGMATEGKRNPDGSINYPVTELACHYIKTYAFQIDTLTNPRIKDFDKIVALARERNWNLVFNLLAENIVLADSLVGKELVYFMKQNRDLLIKRYNKNGAIVVDNLECVPNKEFIDQNWTTEHYAENGRRIVAKNVADSLRKLYPTDFKPVVYNTAKLSEFFNDCEGITIWNQMQTLSSENSYSGQKCSKTGKDQDFSITFEYPVLYLPDSLNKISVNFQVFQAENNHDAKLSFEISGKVFPYRLDGVLINELTQTVNKWNRVSYTYQLPDNFYLSDLIKIYVYNPSNIEIKIDDLKIEFLK